jgi:hypothetical protein
LAAGELDFDASSLEQLHGRDTGSWPEEIHHARHEELSPHYLFAPQSDVSQPPTGHIATGFGIPESPPKPGFPVRRRGWSATRWQGYLPRGGIPKPRILMIPGPSDVALSLFPSDPGCPGSEGWCSSSYFLLPAAVSYWM